MIFIRSLIFNIVAYSIIVWGCISSSIIGVFSKSATVYMWNNIYLPLIIWNLGKICNLRIEVRGREHIVQSNAIYASKHQSALETYTLTCFVKKGLFVLKKELTYIPIFGWTQYFYGMIAVDRAAGSSAMRNMLKGVKEKFSEGRSVIIFPEGTRTKPCSQTQYKPGLLFIAQNIDAPVIPIALNTGMFWAKSSFMRYPGKIIVEFMPPMERNLPKKEFMALLEKTIEDKCHSINEETFKNYPDVALRFGK